MEQANKHCKAIISVHMSSTRAIVSAGLLALLAALVPDHGDAAQVHIAFLTDCSIYSNWQALGMAFSFPRTQVDAKITRVMCCTEEEKAKYPPELLKIMPTHVAPSFAHNPRTNDWYAAYNKPGAVVDWLKHVEPEEEWILVLDSDMYLRHPFLPNLFNASRGWAVSADYRYLIGVKNDLAIRHIPEVAPRNDTLAGPMGRRADQVGGFFWIHREDLKKVAPLWLNITEAVREDSESWRLSGDQYVEKGGRPWISEMYGYVFAAAKANVWHKWDLTTMHYPTYNPDGVPKVMHYGLLFSVGGYQFDKHWHYDMDVTKCPPWDLKDPKRRTGGVFAHAPRPSELKNQDRMTEHYRDLLSIETAATLNAAFCDYYMYHCPPSEQLIEVCKEAFDRYFEARNASLVLESHFDCLDFHAKCPEWSAAGECQKNADYMAENCKKSCNACTNSLSQKVFAQPENGVPDPRIYLKHLEEALHASKASGGAAVLNPDQANSGKNPDEKSGKQVAKDPDATKAAATPVIIPRNTVSPVVQQQASPVVQQQAAVQSPIPKTTASPEVKASTQTSAPTTTVTKPTTGTHATATASPKVVPRLSPKASPTVAQQKRRDLMIACYRMTLSLDEVKECVAAAKEGLDYTPKHPSPVANDDSTKITDLADLKEEDLLSDSKPDVEEPTVHKEQTDPTKPVRSTMEDAQVVPAPKKSVFKSSWQVLAMWLGALAVLLVVVPRVFKLRRRARSGQRTD